jgi:hypothetical protein
MSYQRAFPAPIHNFALLLCHRLRSRNMWGRRNARSVLTQTHDMDLATETRRHIAVTSCRSRTYEGLLRYQRP